MRRGHHASAVLLLAALAVLHLGELLSGRAFLGMTSSKASSPSRNQPGRLATIPLPNGELCIDYAMMGYRCFVPRLYNWCKELGMKKGRIMPSIGFSADENQGYCTVQILKHFGTFPYTHGYFGGILALDRHKNHAAHGEDMVIVHAAHVGYDPETQKFGVYRRLQVSEEGEQISNCCGAIGGVLGPYEELYAQALNRISVSMDKDVVLVSLSNSILRDTQEGGDGPKFYVDYDSLLEGGAAVLDSPYEVLSTAKVYKASPQFTEACKEALAAGDAELDASRDLSGGGPIAVAGWRFLSEPRLQKLLDPSMFYFLRPSIATGEENRLERTLIPHMPSILYGPWDDELIAAMIITQSEFDRALHNVAQEPAYKGKNLVLISGLNIDISPAPDMERAFPSTNFLPWASYVQLADGRSRVLEQPETIEALVAQSDKNKDAIDIEEEIADLFSRERRPVMIFDRLTGDKEEARVS